MVCAPCAEPHLIFNPSIQCLQKRHYLPRLWMGKLSLRENEVEGSCIVHKRKRQTDLKPGSGVQTHFALLPPFAFQKQISRGEMTFQSQDPKTIYFPNLPQATNELRAKTSPHLWRILPASSCALSANLMFPLPKGAGPNVWSTTKLAGVAAIWALFVLGSR